METILAGLTGFVWKVSVSGADKPTNRIVSIPNPGQRNQRLRVTDSTLCLIFKVGGYVPLEKFKPIYDIALRDA